MPSFAQGIKSYKWQYAMDWKAAISLMCLGHSVQRASQQRSKQLTIPDPLDPDEDLVITETGEEPCILAEALTVDGQPVQVFQGLHSKVLFYPRPVQVTATDWVQVNLG
jgi:hypothetical protein